jgi:2-methylisocitrate lyase-like PEP mutase family enzyme
LDRSEQTDRAGTFLDLHHAPEILVLPNVWDPLGARLLEELGFPAVATASAAVAFSLGYDDGQRIRVSTMVEVVRRIAGAVSVPVTADLEAGYAVEPETVAANVREVLRAGAVGINLEDSVTEGGELHAIELQCARIRAVRAMAVEENVPLVINARTDVFLRKEGGPRAARVTEAIERGHAYVEAGADCFYPITVGDLPTLTEIRAAVGGPLNVLATVSAASAPELEAAGVARLSFGPGLIRASITAMKNAVESLRRTGSYESFTRGTLTSDEIRAWVRDTPEP